MIGKNMLWTGGCMCGAVRFEARGEPIAIGHCHCESCRRHTGTPVVTYVGFLERNVTFQGEERRRYKSSPGVVRAFLRQMRIHPDVGRYFRRIG